MSGRARRFLTVTLVALSVLAVTPTVLAHDAPPREDALTGEIRLEQDLRVADGEALHVGPGAAFKGPGRVLVYGTLTVHGNATAPVAFRTPVLTFPGSTVTVHDATFTTPGVTSLDARGGTVDVTGVRFDRALTGVRVEAPPGDAGAVVVRNATFRNVTTGVTVAGATDARVVNASFDGAFVGVDVTLGPRAATRVLVEDAWFRESVARVRVVDDVHAGSRVTVTGSTFEGRSLDTGDAAVAGRAALGVDVLGGNASSGHEAVASRGNAFLVHEVGLAVHAPAQVADAGTLVTSTRDAFEGNAVGVRVANARVTVREPTFGGNLEWDVHAPGALGVRLTLEDVPPGARVLTGAPVVPLATPAPVAPSALVAGALLVLGLVAGAALRPAAAGALPLVARALPERARNADARERVRAYVTTNPGVPAARVAHATGIPAFAVRVHARVLEREGALLVQRSASGRALYHARLADAPAPEAPAPAPAAAPAADARDAPPTLTRAERDVLTAILADPGSTQSALADGLGTTRQAVHYQVKKLVRAGLVTKVPHGRETRLYARDEARAALDATPDA